MRLRAQRREVLPNIPASLRSESGLPPSTLRRYAATAAALVSFSPLALPAIPASVRIWSPSWYARSAPSRPGPLPWSARATAWSLLGSRARRSAAAVRMIHTSISYDPTRLTAGQAATTAPTNPRDQPWATFAASEATMPSTSIQRDFTYGVVYTVLGRCWALQGFGHPV